MFDDLDMEDLRRGGGVKWSAVAPGVLPAWIADMDFPAAPPVRDALLRGIQAGSTYPAWDDHPERNPLRDAFADRMRRRYGFAADPAHVRLFTELIQALQAVLYAVTRPGDGVALHTPAYPPFVPALADMDRPLIPIPMTETADGWGFDAERFASDAARHGCRVLVLVNPQNPTGRAFGRAELEALAEVAERQDLLVISDEIHADLVHDPHRHVPFASLGPGQAARTVTLTSASKAFNIAGQRCSVAHLGSRAARDALGALPPLLFGEVSALSVAATLAAWRDGDDWLAGVRAVLDRNRMLVAGGLPPETGHHVPDATYLSWLDCRGAGLAPDPARFFLEAARVQLSDGRDFGPGGDGFVRLNFATSQPILEEILGRMRKALNSRTTPNR